MQNMTAHSRKTHLCHYGIAALLVAVFLIDIFPTLMEKSSSQMVVIESTGQASSFSQGSTVTVSYIAFNNVKQPAANFVTDDTSFAVTDDGYGFTTGSTGTLTFSAPLFASVEIALEGAPDGGHVQISCSGSTRVIDLANQGTQVYCHPVTTPLLAWCLLIAQALVALLALAWLVRIIDVRLSHAAPRMHAVLASPLLWLIVLCGAVRVFWAGYIGGYLVNGDTSSYTEFSIEDGDAALRTPVYPLLIQFSTFLFGEGEGLSALVVVQSAMGIISAAIVYRLLVQLTSRTPVAFVGAAAFGCLPFVIAFEHAIGTEPTAILVVLLEIDLFARFLKRPSRGRAFGLGALSLVCVMTRPAFLFLVALLALLWLVRLFVVKRERLISAFGMLGVAFCASGIIAYCAFNAATTGIFQLSYVSTEFNQGYIVTSENFYDNVDEPDFTENVAEERYENGNYYWDSYPNLRDVYSSEEYQSLIKASLISNLPEFVNYIGSKVAVELTSSPVGNVISDPSTWTRSDGETLPIADTQSKAEVCANSLLCPFTMASIYLIVIVEIVLCIRQTRRNGSIPWLSYGICAILLAQVLTNYLGAYSQYCRLFLPCLSTVYLVTFDLIGRLLSRQEATAGPAPAYAERAGAVPSEEDGTSTAAFDTHAAFAPAGRAAATSAAACSGEVTESLASRSESDDDRCS